MRRRSPFAIAAGLAALLLVAPAAEAADITPRQAMQIMQKAGYWGIGGVTHNDPYYFAAAVGPDRKRVRVTVDARTGAIVSVMALPRGAGAPTPTGSSVALPAEPKVTVNKTPIPPRSYYQPPQQVQPIGTVPIPGTPAWTRAPLRCRMGYPAGC